MTRVIYPGRADHPQADIDQAKQMTRRLDADLPSTSKGGKKAAFEFANALEIVRISNNLGDAKSLITHPATTTHKSLTEDGARRARHQAGHAAALGRAGGLEDLAEDWKRAVDAALIATPA